MLLSLTHNGRQFINCSAAELAEAGVPAATIDDAVAAVVTSDAHRAIDAICDALYTHSPSRDARYNNKYDEAIRYRDANWPSSVAEADYPTLVNEAPKRGLTKRQLAEQIIARRDAFNLLGGKAEATRAEIETSVAAAAGADAVCTTFDEIRSLLLSDG